MSTCYRFDGVVSTKKLLKAADILGFTVAEKNEEDGICLTNGDSYLWFFMCNNAVVEVCRHGNNCAAEESILKPLAEELQTTYVSEYEDAFFEEIDSDDL